MKGTERDDNENTSKVFLKEHINVCLFLKFHKLTSLTLGDIAVIYWVAYCLLSMKLSACQRSRQFSAFSTYAHSR